MQLKQIVEYREAPANIINGSMEPVFLQPHAPIKLYGQTQHSTVFLAWAQIALLALPANQHFISLIIKKDFVAHAKQVTGHSAPAATQLNAKPARLGTF